jgi:hypothetical protein
MNETYSNLDPKQIDLLNKKMQQVSNDPMLADDLPSSKLAGLGTSMSAAFTGSVQPTAPMSSPGISTIVSPDSVFATPQKADAIKSKIAEIERELGSLTADPVAESELTYRDSTGNETFYVKNICGGHYILSDMQMDKIPAGKSVDLLQMASLEELKKSRDLRKAIRGIGSERTLQRLTEREYLEEKRKELENKKRLDILQQQDQLRRMNQPNPQQQQQLLPHERQFEPNLANRGIRPAIEARLGKLALRTDSNADNRRQAMSSYEFIAWLQQERLTHAEIENIMGHPSVVNDHDIRAALLEKKKSTPPE